VTTAADNARREGPRPALPGRRRSPAEDRKFVTALARGLDVLRAFGPRDRWLTNQEMSRRTGLAKPTVSRLAYTLTRIGFLRFSEQRNRYALGSAAVHLGYTALGQMEVRQVARPLMQELSQHARASVHLAIADRRSMQVVDTYWGTAAFVVDIGSRIPMATTSLGRAFLCALPPAERKRQLEWLREARPDDWPTTRKRLEQAFRDYEELGFCFGLGDWRREVNAVAVPLLPPDGSEPVVIGCSGPAFQLGPEALRRDVGPRLLALAGNVLSALRRDEEHP
jgi:DNA-binding IclR family transcriptional regulator